jgi:hypothetical protein
MEFKLHEKNTCESISWKLVAPMLKMLKKMKLFLKMFFA